MKRLLAALCLCSVAVAAHAALSQRFGPLEVYYNAQTTDELAPEVARAYKIDRSKTRGLLTISVLKDNRGGAATPVEAKVSAYATNLSGQLADVPIREVKSGGAIYYLGDFRVVAPQTLRFHITIDVPGVSKNDLEFTQPFYP